MAVKEVHGPGPRGARGPRPKVENPGKLLKRIMDEVFRNYLPHCILVLICIVVSALANVPALHRWPGHCCGWAASTLWVFWQHGSMPALWST